MSGNLEAKLTQTCSGDPKVLLTFSQEVKELKDLGSSLRRFQQEVNEVISKVIDEKGDQGQDEKDFFDDQQDEEDEEEESKPKKSKH